MEETIFSSGEKLTKAKNDFMNEIYKSFRIPQIVEFLNKKFKKKCKHLNKKVIWIDYQDDYVEYECLDCGEKIFQDL